MKQSRQKIKNAEAYLNKQIKIIFYGVDMYEKLTIRSGDLFVPKPKSVAYIGNENYKTMLPVDQHFNWFQKLMWKLCFGVRVEDYIEE